MNDANGGGDDRFSRSVCDRGVTSRVSAAVATVVVLMGLAAGNSGAAECPPEEPLAEFEPDLRDARGETPLHEAVRAARDWLRTGCAGAYWSDEPGGSAMEQLERALTQVRSLLCSGADAFAVNDANESPLMLARAPLHFVINLAPKNLVIAPHNP